MNHAGEPVEVTTIETAYNVIGLPVSNILSMGLQRAGGGDLLPVDTFTTQPCS